MNPILIGRESLLDSTPIALQRLMQFERFHLHKSSYFFQNVVKDASFDTKYLPQNCGVFELPCYWIKRKHFFINFSQQPRESELQIFETFGGCEFVLYPVHPMEAARYADFLERVSARSCAEDGLRIFAVPTSSTRTLLVWEERQPRQCVFLKLSLSSLVFGDRQLSRRKVAASIGINRLAMQSLTHSEQWRYMSEVVGVVPRIMPGSGVIVRSVPSELTNDSSFVIPLFALLGGVRPVMLSMIQQGIVLADEFIDEILCKTFAKIWVSSILKDGLIPEAHCQDVLLGATTSLQPLKRFYYRDMEGLTVDWELRRALRLPCPDDLPLASAWFETYAGWPVQAHQQMWCKYHNSLQQYLHLVLHEVDESMQQWHADGSLSGARPEENFATASFSRHVRREVVQHFGLNEGADYDIHDSITEFVGFLLQVRKSLLADSATWRYR